MRSDDERQQDSGSKGKKKAKAKAKAKGGKPSTSEHLLDLSKSFDKGMPKPTSRAQEKKQKAEQLANLLRIQKELTSDYKVRVDSVALVRLCLFPLALRLPFDACLQ